MSIALKDAVEKFKEEFGRVPSFVARAPGRVNIIGEHTDYNHGFVLPMAIERETVLVGAPRRDRQIYVYAANLCRRGVADIANCVRNREEPWMDYLVGVAHELLQRGLPVSGVDALVWGDVPIGAGLSSSASLEMATLAMFEHLGSFQLEGREAAQLGKRMENEFLGVKSGIMDQFIVRLGRENCALFLDCRTEDFEQIPVAFDNAVFVIADSGVKRGLAGSKYNERVQECLEAVDALKKSSGKSGTHLRDFGLEDLGAAKHSMREVVYRRARHVLTENERTREACNALRHGELVRLGTLMNESDESLRVDYEVTCPELDALTEIARSVPGCYGARMTGAGFGGCTVNLVAKDKVQHFADTVLSRYRQRTGIESRIIFSRPAPGASVLAL
ncbi:MAG TPA: galactokinase [Candidatus Hydrogenedentes bacterium]|nr:galactokinase [Candidatus Hydrogenedentota bacterium]HOL78229.1 galactokinase [Candidatus Hydrogenedentota bacterium]HPO84534.1 galactokinase [Candidatus Hydrogenedentota bacterium]